MSKPKTFSFPMGVPSGLTHLDTLVKHSRNRMDVTETYRVDDHRITMVAPGGTLVFHGAPNPIAHEGSPVVLYAGDAADSIFWPTEELHPVQLKRRNDIAQQMLKKGVAL